MLVTKANWNQASWTSDLLSNYKPEVSTMMLRKSKSCALCGKHYLGPFHTHRNRLKQISGKTQQFPWQTENHCTLGSSLVRCIRDDFTPTRHAKEGRFPTRPKCQLHVSRTPIWQRAWHHACPQVPITVFKNNFSSRVYHI